MHTTIPELLTYFHTLLISRGSHNPSYRLSYSYLRIRNSYHGL